MKQLIRRILKESVKEKLQKRLEEDGLVETLNTLGITFQELLSMLGMSMDEFPKKYNPFEGILSMEKLEKGYNSALNEFVNDIPTTLRTYRYSPKSIKHGVVDFIYLKFYWDLVDNTTEIDIIPNTYDLLEIMIYPLVEKDPRYKKIVDSIIKESVQNILIEEIDDIRKERIKNKFVNVLSSSMYIKEKRFNRTKKILTESMREKLLARIQNDGLEETLNTLGITFQELLQLLNLTKNEKYPLFQSIIDEAISVIKYQCETMNDEDNEYISVGACDFIDALVKLEVVDITNDTTIKVRIEYKYLGYLDEDTFIYELEHELKNYGDFKIDVIDSINTHNRQW